MGRIDIRPNLQLVDGLIRGLKLPDGIELFDTGEFVLLLQPKELGYRANYVVYLWRAHEDGRRMYVRRVDLGFLPLAEPENKEGPNWAIALARKVAEAADAFQEEILTGKADYIEDGGVLP